MSRTIPTPERARAPLAPGVATDPAFDDLARIAAQLCEATVAILGVVEGDRARIAAVVGLPGGGAAAEPLCAEAMRAAAPLVVHDLRDHPALAAHPLVTGEPRLRFFAGAPLWASDGSVIGALCVADRAPQQLARAQRQSLEALARQAVALVELRRTTAEAEERFHRLSAAANEGIAVSVAGVIVEVNHAFCHLFGCDETAAIGRAIGDFTTPASREDVTRRAREREDGSFEVTGLRADGTTFDLQISAKTAPYRGRTARVAVLRDITAQNAVDRMKNEFVSTVSHELRTPLTSVRGSLGLIEGGAAGEVAPRALELVRIARANTDRLIRLINDILDLEKMEAGKLELRTAPVAAADLVATAIAELRSAAQESDITLVAQPAPGLRAIGDHDRLVQVLVNLVGNAIKFSAPGRAVTVRTQEGAPGFVRFAVADEGPGIAREHLARLFRRFQQLDASDGRERGGTGLGLVISRSIVEQHGGRLGVKSEVGVGTEFFFEIPELPGPARAPTAHRDAPGNAPTVLVVEDDGDLAELLRLILERDGYRVACAFSTDEARRLARELPPAVILLDVGLPDGNGLVLLEQLRAEAPLASVPAVVLSGLAPDDFPRRPLLVDWIAKPLEEGYLLRALRQALRPAGAPRVLVVDADAGVRAVIDAQLRPIGVDVLEAGDATQALVLARAVRPDLIVLDDGAELVEALRRDGQRSTPLLVYSGRDLPIAERRVLTLGITRHLTKARASADDLLCAVRELLGRLLPPERAAHRPV